MDFHPDRLLQHIHYVGRHGDPRPVSQFQIEPEPGLNRSFGGGTSVDLEFNAKFNPALKTPAQGIIRKHSGNTFHRPGWTVGVRESWAHSCRMY
ncbi:hypothetical protein AOLI_G00211310 [Acnodon oligacanthus]